MSKFIKFDNDSADIYGLSELLKLKEGETSGLAYGDGFTKGDIMGCFPYGTRHAFLFCPTAYTKVGGEEKKLKNVICTLNTVTAGCKINDDFDDNEKWVGFDSNGVGLLTFIRKDRVWVRLFIPDDVGNINRLGEFDIGLSAHRNNVLGCSVTRDEYIVFFHNGHNLVQRSIKADAIGGTWKSKIIKGVEASPNTRVAMQTRSFDTYLFVWTDTSFAAYSMVRGLPTKEGAMKHDGQHRIWPNVQPNLQFGEKTDKVVFTTQKSDGDMLIDTLEF